MSEFNNTRRKFLKTGMVIGAGISSPMIFTNSYAAYRNEPKGSNVTFGFNVPQTGAYADEGADELRAYELAVKHINGEGDGGMLNTFSSKALRGNGVNGKKVTFVTGDTQTKSDAARASARRRRDDHRRLFIGRCDCGSGLMPRSRRHFHGWPDSL